VGEGHFVLFHGEAKLECTVDVSQTRFQYSTQGKRKNIKYRHQIADMFRARNFFKKNPLNRKLPSESLRNKKQL